MMNLKTWLKKHRLPYFSDLGAVILICILGLLIILWLYILPYKSDPGGLNYERYRGYSFQR